MDTIRKGTRVRVRHTRVITGADFKRHETVTTRDGTIVKKTTYGGKIGYNVQFDGEYGITNIPEHEIKIL